MNSVKSWCVFEATHGMEVVAEYVAWVSETSVEEVASVSGKRVSVIREYQRAFSLLRNPRVQAAARKAELSLTVVLDIARLVYPLRYRTNRRELLVQLCGKVAGLSADDARKVITDTVDQWVGDTSSRLDVACMHTHIGKDGKRRLVAAFSTPVAARIDAVVHAAATKLMTADPRLQYDQAYAQVLTQKLTDTTTSGKDAGLFGPMFMISTDCHFHADGKITTTDGALVNIQEVVDEKLAPCGWAAVTGTSDESPHIPLVGALIQVRRRFATKAQRLAAIMETLVCAWPGCEVAAAKCQTHHIQAYAHGGQTSGVNLTMLCKHHNGCNDDHPGQHVNGHIERDSITGRPGLRRHPSQPLKFNTHPITTKTTHHL